MSPKRRRRGRGSDARSCSHEAVCGQNNSLIGGMSLLIGANSDSEAEQICETGRNIDVFAVGLTKE